MNNPAPNVANQSFPKSRRLLKHADFERVYKQGRRHFSRHMTVFYLDREVGAARVGFTVSKALGGAVQRNRMKRRLREAVRLTGLGNDFAVDIVINPKRTLLKAEFGDLRDEILKAIEVIGKNIKRKNTSADRGQA